MLRLVALAAATLLSLCTAVNESPIGKVITLLEDLKTDVEDDGKDEAKAYKEYACFCKDTNKAKSESITKGENKIENLSADITKNTAEKEKKEAEVAERKEKHEELGESLKSEVTRCSTAQGEYEATKADMTKAIESLEKAQKAMKAKMGKAGGAALLEMPEAEDVAHGLALADVMNLFQASQRQLIGSFLQGAGKVDPKDPAYKYHSKEINELLAKLIKQFNGNKDDNQDKWDKIDKACGENQKETGALMKENLDAIAKAEEDIEDLQKTIAADREDLVEAQTQLEDDELYLKDLTKQCEARANDWDQRSKMRNDEIEALSTALKIIKDDAKENYKDTVDKKDEVFLQAVKGVEEADAQILRNIHPVSLLQWGSSSDAPAGGAFLDKRANSAVALKNQVMDLLRVEGNRLKSPVLSSLAMTVARQQDPFLEVKKLIQGLIERLLDEAKAEASKKGFCDMELAKAQKDRDYAIAKSKAISADLAVFEAKKEELEKEIKELKKDIKETRDELAKAKDLRDKDHDQNVELLKKANEGLKAVQEATLVLKAFYSKASRAKVLLQASPVDDDTSGPGFDGAYKAKQGASKAIFEVLATIEGNFETNIRETEKAEAEAQADFVEFDRTSKSTISEKETKYKLDEQDLKTTKSDIETGLDDLGTQMGLVDDAVNQLEELKPACLDTGMGYKDRVEKREAEIAALQKALCIIDPKGEDCGK